jgi:serine/threonine-protein kinase RsbW
MPTQAWRPAVCRVPPDSLSAAPADRSGSAEYGEGTVRLDIQATASAVRGALAALRQALTPLVPTCSELDAVELVVAEVLNNVVEHAYAGTEGGRVRVTAWPAARGLVFRVEDEGCPMPGGRLPPGDGPAIGPAIGDLPEGGFGWFIIHKLTCDLTYRRIGRRNCLTFRMGPGRSGAD